MYHRNWKYLEEHIYAVRNVAGYNSAENHVSSEYGGIASASRGPTIYPSVVSFRVIEDGGSSYLAWSSLTFEELRSIINDPTLWK